MRRLALLVLLGALAAACSGADASDVTQADLDGRTFVSTEVVGRRLTNGTRVEVRFEDGDVSFDAGCNDTSGPYELDGGRIDLEDEEAFTTLGYCLGGGNPRGQDRWVKAFMTDRPVAELVGERLTLTRGADLIRFRIRGAGQPQATQP